MPDDLTLGRILRIVSERWLALFVFVATGTGLGYGLTYALPRVYEAHAEFTMNVKLMSGRDRNGRFLDHDYGSEYAEVYNTRIYEWCSEPVLAEVLRDYRVQHPGAAVSDETLVAALSNSRLELVPRSHLLTLTVRGADPKLVADLANGYVKTIESYAARAGHQRALKAVEGMASRVVEQKAKVTGLTAELASRHKLGKIEELRTDIQTREKQLADLSEQLRETELEDRSLFEWVKILREVKRAPEKFGTLSSKAPRAAEINDEYDELVQALMRFDALISAYTKKHPAVKLAAREVETARTRFREATRRALATGAATLRENHNRLLALRTRVADCEKALGDLRQEMVKAENDIRRIEEDLAGANRILEQLMLTMEHARSGAEVLTDTIAVGLPAEPPEKPIFPDPLVFTGAGAGTLLLAGLFFVIARGRRDDRIRSVDAIESELGFDVLAVLPQEERSERRLLARSPEFDRHGGFAEGAAALRNQLDSPRFDAFSRRVLVLSTQPGEGKTSVSTALAIASAQVKRHTLLVDFDLRRPQQARIWDLKLTRARSFSHVLQGSLHGPAPDYGALVNATTVPGLDVIASLPPDGIHPASIFGSRTLRDFFVWARAHYDRVVVDAPPWGLVGDTLKLAMMVDSVLVMCRPGTTSAAQIVSCGNQLAEAGARVLGVVVNGVSRVEAASFVPGHHREDGVGLDRAELLEHTRCFVDEE